MEEDLGLFHADSVRDYGEDEEEPEEKDVQSKDYVPNDFVRYRAVRDRWIENFSHLQRQTDSSEARDKVGWLVELTELKTNELVRYGITYEWCKRRRLPHVVDLAAEQLEKFSAFPELVKWAQGKLSTIAEAKIKTLVPSGQRKKLTKEEVHMIAITSGVAVTERRLGWWARQELFSSPGHDTIETISGRLDFGVSVFLDLLAKSYLKHLASNPDQKLPLLRDGEFYESAEEEIAVARGLKELRKTDINSIELRQAEVEIRESDFKAIQPFRGYSARQIEAIVEKASKIIVSYRTNDFCSVDEDGNERKEWLVWKDLLFHLTTRYAARRQKGKGHWKAEETCWIVSCYSPILLGMLSELKKGHIKLLPPEFYDLSGRTQELFRSIFWSRFNPVHFSLEQARKRLGWKKPKSLPNVSQQITYIKQCLEEAREKGFIEPAGKGKSWTSGKGEETAFHVRKLNPFKNNSR
jgi:hypothetical protein